MENIFNYSLCELEEKLVENKFKKYRAKQIFSFLYDKKISDFDNMHNLGKDLTFYLKDNFKIGTSSIDKVVESTDTTKFLIKLKDDNYIEAVAMNYNYGTSLCVSTQIGCNIGCSFCASGEIKKIRDLSAGEIIEQIFHAEKYLNEKIKSVVIMGIGEPFDNYSNTIKFIKLINDVNTFNIGSRRITVSTSGIVPKIMDFANEDLGVNLAISLHAPTNSVRSKIMKINDVYNVDSLIKAVSHYIDKTNRRVTIEYVMLKDINDDKIMAKELSKLLRGLNVYVNLIPYNETNGLYKRSSKETIMKFYDTLKKEGINVTVRRELGLDIEGACGMLRARKGD